MIILEQIKIKNESDIIYAKRTLQNILKRLQHPQSSYLVFCLMELSTNLHKYTEGGEIWILQDSQSQIHIASLDNGGGIENIHWAMENGTSQKENSLGIGLYQMNHDALYHVEIVSYTKESMHGTVVLVSPRDYNPAVCSLGIPYITEKVSGDLFVKKGRFLLLADSSGHGKKAYKTAVYLKSLFYKHPFSCLIADEFFDTIHKYLKRESMRGAVLSVMEVSASSVQICGVGNISFWVQNDKEFQYISQKEGIVGEVFANIDKHSFHLKKHEKLIAATDGMDVGKMEKMLQELPKKSSSLMIALCAMNFASVVYDDKTIVILEQKGRENDR